MVLDDVDRPQLVWWLFGAVLAGAVIFVVHSFIGTFVFGVFVYYATRPIYRRLSRRVQPPSLAAAVSLLALALPAILLVLYAVAIVVRELTRLLQNGEVAVLERLGVDPVLVERVADPARLVELDLVEYVSAEQVTALLGSLSRAADTIAFLGIGAVHLFVIIALAFYLLRDGRRLSRWVHARFDDDRGILRAYLRAIDSDFHSIFFGNILNAILTGTIGVIAYSLLNTVAPAGLQIPSPALVGLLAGVASLVPVVGMKLVYFPVTGVLLARAVAADAGTPGFSFVLLFAAVSFVVVDTIPDLVLRPYVSGRSLHVGAVMLAYTFGPLLFGWYGIFLMPMLLVLVVQFARVVLPQLLRPEPLRPYAVDPTHLTTPAPNAESPAPDAESSRPTAESPAPKEESPTPSVEPPSDERGPVGDVDGDPTE
jgi:predicted PurR-regulated permease PerM